MTVSSSNRKAGPYSGTGSTGPFTFSFKVFEASDVLVVKVNNSTNIETTLTLTTDYTVSLNADQNSNPGGTITLVAALAVGYNMVISSQVPYLQETDLTNQGGFYPEVITDALDKLTIEAQQLKLDVDRSAKLPITSTEDADALVADIVRIADSADNLDTVATNISSVNNVSTNMTKVSTVSTNISNVNTVATDIAAVTTVANDLNEPVSEIETVAGSIANVNVVGNNITNVNAVANNATNVNAVAGNKTNIDAVAGNATNINAVAGNATNINAVNANKTNIDAVAGNATNINAVNANKANIDINAANITDIQNAYENSQIVLSALNEVTDGVRDRFVAGVNYTKNSTSQLTLSNTPLKGETVKVFFSGVYQEKTTWTRVGAVVLFSAAIPVDSVEITYDIGRSFAELDAAVASASGYATTASNHAGTAVTKANEASASASSAVTSASEASASAASAAGSAASAAQIVYGNLITHPNIITESLTIPDGYNAFFIDPVEFGPNVTITGLGNSTLRGV